MRKSTTVLLTMSFAVVLSGCTDMAAVRGISTKLQSASSSWVDVSGEFANSCKREQFLNSDITDCKLEEEASVGLGNYNLVLSRYFKVLGDAAADGNLNIQPGLNAATASIGKIPGINADQVKAASGLVSLLASRFLEYKRERLVRELIDQGSGDARKMVAALDALVVQRLSGRLDSERMQLAGRFRLWLQPEGVGVQSASSDICKAAFPNSATGTGVLLRIEYCRQLAVIEQKITALEAYKQSLGAADSALKALQSEKTKLKGKALINQLFKIGTDLEANVTAVRKAFS